MTDYIMKNEFANEMLNKNFKNASKIVYDSILDIKVPANVNLNLNIDEEFALRDLEGKLMKAYNDVEEAYNEISFQDIWDKIFLNSEFENKQELRANNKVIDATHNAFEQLMNKLKINRYIQVFEIMTSTLNASLQGIIDASVKL